MSVLPRKPAVSPVEPFVHKNNVALRNLLKDRIAPFAKELYEKSNKKEISAKDREKVEKIDSLAEQIGLPRLNGRGYLETLLFWFDGIDALHDEFLKETEDENKNEIAWFKRPLFDSIGKGRLAELDEVIRAETGLILGTTCIEGEIAGVCELQILAHIAEFHIAA